MKEIKESFSFPDEILHLLTHKALGKLDASGLDKLNGWIRENPDAEPECNVFMVKVKKIHWTYYSNEIADPNVVIEEYLPMKSDKRPFIHVVYPYLAMAATLLILIGFIWYFVYHRDRKSAETAHNETPALERQNKAILVLSDGKSLELDNSGCDELTAESGVRITNQPGELLRYEQEQAVDDESRMNRLIVPSGARYQLQLADGTKVWMNSHSELEYPVSFTGDKRKVRLSGEAYFEVMANPSAPFIIEANGYEIFVFGTQLNISAYSGDSFIQTTLVSGALEVNSREGDAYKLTPGQMAMIVHDDQKVLINNVDTRLFTSWRDGILYFNKISLKELAVKLERWYDVEILFDSDQTAGLLFSGAMENSRDIQFLLRLIGEAANVEFEIEGKQIYVK
ncbi:MAG: FecR domain-containing protein [Bacteroidales bacterium]|nr:FecR domain-containing protein [Bacteroidales bacterium]